MSLFARQHISLLRGVGVRVRMGGALALTYTRSALAISMPAGTAVSAGFAYQRFRRWGAGRESATAVVIMSGVCSFVALMLLYVVGFLLGLLAAPVSTWQDQPVLTIAVLAVSAATAALLVRHRIRARAPLTIDGPVDEEDLDYLATAPDVTATDEGSGPHARPGLLRTQLQRLGQLLRDVVAVAESMPAAAPHRGARLRGAQLAHRPGVPRRGRPGLPPAAGPAPARHRLRGGAAGPADPDHARRHRGHRGDPASRADGRGRRAGRRRGDRARLPAAVLLARHPGRPHHLGVPAPRGP